MDGQWGGNRSGFRSTQRFLSEECKCNRRWTKVDQMLSGITLCLTALPACLPGIIWCDDYHLLFSCIPAELEAEVNEETRWCLVLAKNSLEAPEQFMMCEPEVVHTWAAAAAVLGIPSRSVCTSINEIESDNIVGKLIAQQPRRLSVWRERPNILCVKGLSSH